MEGWMTDGGWDHRSKEEGFAVAGLSGTVRHCGGRLGGETGGASQWAVGAGAALSGSGPGAGSGRRRMEWGGWAWRGWAWRWDKGVWVLEARINRASPAAQQRQDAGDAAESQAQGVPGECRQHRETARLAPRRDGDTAQPTGPGPLCNLSPPGRWPVVLAVRCFIGAVI